VAVRPVWAIRNTSVPGSSSPAARLEATAPVSLKTAPAGEGVAKRDIGDLLDRGRIAIGGLR
jgi:hypothetical protein